MLYLKRILIVGLSFVVGLYSICFRKEYAGSSECYVNDTVSTWGTI